MMTQRTLTPRLTFTPGGGIVLYLEVSSLDERAPAIMALADVMMSGHTATENNDKTGEDGRQSKFNFNP